MAEPLPESLLPRSARAHACALSAARDLLAEGGLPAATVDAISARSGVSKATLYKHWPSRTALAAEAFGREMADAIPSPCTGDPRADLVEQVRRVSAFYAGPTGEVFAQLLAACVTDPPAAPFFREFFLDGRRAAISVLWQRLVDAGQASPTVDVETATDVLFGPLIFRRLTGHAPLTVAEADAISSAALEGLLKRE
ncbi:TetR/AcrR family transcriptional regulator [Amycolatopsis sp. NPDC050768]|uniref:TetR/AcrR family transcriptional regulator n=1 Tax=Amycolatopsis sp. NPDC050768 TaxID=3154839 RepID=UPI00340C8221